MLDSGYFHRHHGFKEGEGGCTPARGPRRFLPFTVLKSQSEECAEEKHQPEDPALISYLIYFSPDRGFGLGEGLEHFGCFS